MKMQTHNELMNAQINVPIMTGSPYLTTSDASNFNKAKLYMNTAAIEEAVIM